MRLLGIRRTNFSFPVCTSFQPRVMDGQLCYSIDLVNATKQRSIKQGPSHGLTLFLDYNEERMKNTNTGVEQLVNLVANMNEENKKKKQAKIHINTLEPFVGFGGGNYEMSAIKVMAATESFLGLPEDVRDCQTEYTLQECHLEHYRASAKSCGCVPLSLPGLFHNDTV